MNFLGGDSNSILHYECSKWKNNYSTSFLKSFLFIYRYSFWLTVKERNTLTACFWKMECLDNMWRAFKFIILKCSCIYSVWWKLCNCFAAAVGSLTMDESSSQPATERWGILITGRAFKCTVFYVFLYLQCVVLNYMYATDGSLTMDESSSQPATERRDILITGRAFKCTIPTCSNIYSVWWKLCRTWFCSCWLTDK